MAWHYEGKVITEITDMPEGTIGFVYMITNKEDGKFYIDVNDNGYANIISYQNSDNDGWNISIDRNSNRVIDGFGLVSVDQNGKYSFRWLLDENEDGVVDRVAIDYNGDWKTDKAYPLYPKGSSFSF